jgi:hypothetical protein
MSKGPGRAQRAILALIAGNPDGAWTTDELCREVYAGINRVEKKHRVAVLRALRTMTLPGMWRVRRLSRAGVEHCLFEPCSDESQTRFSWLQSRWEDSFDNWRTSRPRMVERARERSKEARKYRDASPVEKLDIDIDSLQTQIGFLGMALQNGGDRELCTSDLRKMLGVIAELKVARAKLVAG